MHGTAARFALGDVTVSRVVESEGPTLSAREVFPDWDPAVVEAHRSWMVPRHFDTGEQRLVITIQSYLVKTGRYTILVDACGGNDKSRARPHFHKQQHPWLQTLAAAGARPEDIDFVLCTHLHVDHVGWNTRLVNGRWVPTFPNAKYIFSKKELAHWEREAKATGLPRTGDYVSDSVLPIVEARRELLVELDHEIEAGVWLEPLTGHTPGQVGLHVKSTTGEMVMCGDMMHHMIQCHMPNWSTNFCTDQAAARLTRRAFLDRYCETGVLVAPAHFPSPSVGTIERAGKAYGMRYVGE
jgi:glyoxylase-like metal-dependent hydrolase (beta-lactamase superfamily II)